MISEGLCDTEDCQAYENSDLNHWNKLHKKNITNFWKAYV